MKCHFFESVEFVSEKVSWLIVSALALGVIAMSVLYAPVGYSRPYTTEYGKLLETCNHAIGESGYANAHKVLSRKIYSGRRYKLWIDITTDDREEGDAHRAYCEGISRTGELEVFGLSSGAWRNRYWTEDTTQVLQEYANRN